MKNLFILLLAVTALTGCISAKSYVDPSFSKATYEDIKPVEKKYNAHVIVEFQRNGETFSQVNQEVRNHLERTLRATGVIIPASADTNFTLNVVVNNVADMKAAMAKGFGTGLTLGAVGSVV
ncbi:hypothetical protein D5R81_05945 [Parashewanella spongiae]|uniref:Uncharacterized protein n=1 Tax=Parashewanella spongiae TaxID=342950 RepID=A0A3A6U2J4_9GAMM|nr:hypothetical protein [Parashewanella spongiae]MCL1077525.1 hypothetical protein [Parashewanella spongiae]RJY18265.1 hypothetical protein D5R81_05945 [Parashewanella spongiae]